MKTTIAMKLLGLGLVNAKVEQFGKEFKVSVNSVAEVFEAEKVAKQIKADFGVEVYVAY